MLIRVLSEWSGSARCGTVSAVPDDVALLQIAAGRAERVDAPEQVIETHIESAPVEMNTQPTKGKKRR